MRFQGTVKRLLCVTVVTLMTAASSWSPRRDRAKPCRSGVTLRWSFLRRLSRRLQRRPRGWRSRSHGP